MSLFSDVVITMFESDYKEMVSLAKHCCDEDVFRFVEHPDDFSILTTVDERPIVLVCYNNVVWEKSNPAVAFVDSFLNEDISYHFVQKTNGPIRHTYERTNLSDDDDYCFEGDQILEALMTTTC